MAHRKITKINGSKLFWKELGALRNHPDYWVIRANIKNIIQVMERGESPGDRGFRSPDMEGLRHIRVASKLWLFFGHQEEGEVKLVTVGKHDIYGFGNERSNIKASTSKRLQNALHGPNVRSPEWKSIKWVEPSDVMNHPELLELSREGLEALYNELLEEADTLERLEQATKSLSKRSADRVGYGWLDDLDEVIHFVEATLVKSARKKVPYLTPKDFENWGDGPGVKG